MPGSPLPQATRCERVMCRRHTIDGAGDVRVRDHASEIGHLIRPRCNRVATAQIARPDLELAACTKLIDDGDRTPSNYLPRGRAEWREPSVDRQRTADAAASPARSQLLGCDVAWRRSLEKDRSVHGDRPRLSTAGPDVGHDRDGLPCRFADRIGVDSDPLISRGDANAWPSPVAEDRSPSIVSRALPAFASAPTPRVR